MDRLQLRQDRTTPLLLTRAASVLQENAIHGRLRTASAHRDRQNIRKAILRMEFSVIAPCPAHPADIRRIPIDMRMQVRQLEVNGDSAPGPFGR
jgi:hypothetical protein